MARTRCTTFKTYQEAAAFLAKGKNKFNRPVTNNTRVMTLGDGSIGLVLHDTVVVAYHADGTQTIATGGWKSVITKDRLERFSIANVQTIWPVKKLTGQGWAIWHRTDKLAPPRVQKCRTCKGSPYSPSHCPGPGTCYGEEYCWEWRDAPKGICPHGEANGHWLPRCKHGQTAEHQLTECHHGNLGAHDYDAPCYRCNGTGMADYGSYQIPFAWDGSPVHLDATGKVLGTGTDYLAPASATNKSGSGYYTTKSYMGVPVYETEDGKPTTSWNQANPSPTPDQGTQIVAELRRLVPSLDRYVMCPACTHQAKRQLSDRIIHLNDEHRWTREAIADWLEGLDLDLQFSAA